MKSVEDREYQKNLLKQEGIEFLDEFKVDLKKFLWKIDSINNIKTN
ncbi:MAG: hypothetical protein ACFFBF_14665 [Promethearchaeota archaeon]